MLLSSVKLQVEKSIVVKNEEFFSQHAESSRREVKLVQICKNETESDVFCCLTITFAKRFR
jgi:hypothetical protein